MGEACRNATLVHDPGYENIKRMLHRDVIQMQRKDLALGARSEWDAVSRLTSKNEALRLHKSVNDHCDNCSTYPGCLPVGK